MPRFCAVVDITSSVVNCWAICCLAVGGNSARRNFGTTAFTIFSNSALVMTVLQAAEVAAGLAEAPVAGVALPAAVAAVLEHKCLTVMTGVSGGSFAPGSFSAGLASSGPAAAFGEIGVADFGAVCGAVLGLAACGEALVCAKAKDEIR